MSDIKEFISNGFVLKKKLFSNEEINKLNQYIAIRKDKEESARETNTSTGKLTMTMWNHPSEDLFGKFSTNERIVKPMEIFLNDEGCIIVIEDNGPGIPDKNYEDVFKPFFSLDPSRNKLKGESGLGLSITRDIIRAHGGEIKLSKSSYGGLKSLIQLPI